MTTFSTETGLERITKVTNEGTYSIESVPVPEGYRVCLHYFKHLPELESEQQTTIVEEYYECPVKALERVYLLLKQEAKRGFTGYNLKQHQLTVKEMKNTNDYIDDRNVTIDDYEATVEVMVDNETLEVFTMPTSHYADYVEDTLGDKAKVN